MPIVRFKSSDNSPDILVEVDSMHSHSGELEVTNNSGELVVGKARLDSALNTVSDVASQLLDKISTLDVSPTEFEFTLGIKFSAEAGVIIAKTKTEGNLELKFKWKKEAGND